MKKIMFLIFLFSFLMVCIASLGWAVAVDDVKAGQAASRQGDYDNAIVFFTKAIDSGELSQKNLRNAYYERAAAWEGKGEYDKAIADYTKAIEINPQDHLSWYCRARVYAKRGERDKTLSNLKRAITLFDFYKDLFKSDDNFKDFWDDEDFKKLTE